MAERTATLTLRPLRPSDEGFVSELSQRVFAVYSRDPVATTNAMLEEAGAETVVAEVDGTPVGFAVLGIERLARRFGPWRRPAIARLNAVAVWPDLHGRGIGRALLERAEIMALAQDAVTLTLMTAEDNTPARRLFASAGFLEVLPLDNAYRRQQRGIVMFKALG